MCAFSKYNEYECKSGELSVTDWKSILDDLQKSGILLITFTGGESTLYSGFEDVYVYANKLGFLVSIKTNASLLTSNMKQLFRKYPPYKVYITLYGGTNATYYDITNANNCFVTVIDGIDFFASIPTSVIVTFTLLNRNVGDIPIMVNEVSKYPVGIAVCNDLHSHINPNVNVDIDKHRIPASLRVAIDSNVIENMNTIYDDAQALELYRKDMPYWVNEIDNDFSDSVGNCYDSALSAYISSSGRLSYCQLFEFCHSIDIASDGFSHAWDTLQNDKLRFFRIPKKCTKCSLQVYCKANCPARLYLNRKGGNVDNYTCEYAYFNKVMRTIVKNERSEHKNEKRNLL